MRYPSTCETVGREITIMTVDMPGEHTHFWAHIAELETVSGAGFGSYKFSPLRSRTSYDCLQY